MKKKQICYQLYGLEITLFVTPLGNNADNFLEFILDAAGRRLDVDYYELLADMFSKSDIRLAEYGANGTVNITVGCECISEIESTMAAANDIINKWANKYRIRYLKEIANHINHPARNSLEEHKCC